MDNTGEAHQRQEDEEDSLPKDGEGAGRKEKTEEEEKGKAKAKALGIGVKKRKIDQVSTKEREMTPKAPGWYNRRRNNVSKSKKKLLATLWPEFGKGTQDLKYQEKIDLESWWSGMKMEDAKQNETATKRTRWLDIGFGTGEALVQMAESFPEEEFLGVEIYRPGHAHVCSECKTRGLQNIRVFGGNVVKFLMRHCPEEPSFDKINIFFPDPFPDRPKNRLVTDDFIQVLTPLVRKPVTLNLATDVALYLVDVLNIFIWGQGKELGWRLVSFRRTAGPTEAANAYLDEKQKSWLSKVEELIEKEDFPLKQGEIQGSRPSWRPVTHFEQVAIDEGRYVWDLEFRLE